LGSSTKKKKSYYSGPKPTSISGCPGQGERRGGHKREKDEDNAWTRAMVTLLRRPWGGRGGQKKEKKKDEKRGEERSEDRI